MKHLSYSELTTELNNTRKAVDCAMGYKMRRDQVLEAKRVANALNITEYEKVESKFDYVPLIVTAVISFIGICVIWSI